MEFDLHSNQRLNVAKEMYLKAIFELSKKAEIKQSDLVQSLRVSKSSVNEMVKKLQQEGLVEEGLVIVLTEKGEKEANLLYRKFEILYGFLHTVLKVSNARDEACQIEHACSLETVEKLELFLKK